MFVVVSSHASDMVEYTRNLGMVERIGIYILVFEVVP